MEGGAWERYGEILEIAEEDAEYLKMQKDFLEFEKQFHEYADTLPEQIRNFFVWISGDDIFNGKPQAYACVRENAFSSRGWQIVYFCSKQD